MNRDRVTLRVCCGTADDVRTHKELVRTGCGCWVIVRSGYTSYNDRHESRKDTCAHDDSVIRNL